MNIQSQASQNKFHQYPEYINIRLITLEAYASEQVLHNVIIDNYLEHNVESAYILIDKHLKLNPVDIKEFIEIKSDEILIGINTISIDEFAYNRAEELLSQVDILEPGRHEFGDAINFTQTKRHQLITATQKYIM